MSSGSGDLWVAKEENICKSEFEETRRSLLNSYNSNIQTHAGYMIALIIGSLALISGFGAFFQSLAGKIVFIFLIIAIPIVSFYMICRIAYWTYFANITIWIPLDDAIDLFNKHNNDPRSDYKYTKKPPCTAILQEAIVQKLGEDKEKSLRLRIAIAMKSRVWLRLFKYVLFYIFNW